MSRFGVWLVLARGYFERRDEWYWVGVGWRVYHPMRVVVVMVEVVIAGNVE